MSQSHSIWMVCPPTPTPPALLHQIFMEASENRRSCPEGCDWLALMISTRPALAAKDASNQTLPRGCLPGAQPSHSCKKNPTKSPSSSTHIAHIMHEDLHARWRLRPRRWSGLHTAPHVKAVPTHTHTGTSYSLSLETTDQSHWFCSTDVDEESQEK